jgi:hypothetical protein
MGGPDLPGTVPAKFLEMMPYGATAFELGFPVVLLASLAAAGGAGGSAGRIAVRALAISGALFHVFIALPPPPMSVYPFSMIMAPMYIQVWPESVDM